MENIKFLTLKVIIYLNFKHSSKGYFPLIRPSLGKKANEQAGELSGHYSLGTGGLPCKGESYEAWISRPVSIINLIEGLCSLWHPE